MVCINSIRRYILFKFNFFIKSFIELFFNIFLFIFIRFKLDISKSLIIILIYILNFLFGSRVKLLDIFKLLFLFIKVIRRLKCLLLLLVRFIIFLLIKYILAVGCLFLRNSVLISTVILMRNLSAILISLLVV